MALPQLVNTGAFTQANLKAINANFALLAGLAGGGVFGQSFYVDPVKGSDNYDGSADFPTATINKALGKTRSGFGDTIFIAPGEYDENVVVDKDYVALVGGTTGGYGKPDIVSSTGAAITINSQGVILQHLRAAVEGAFAAITMRGNGFVIYDCVCDGDLTALGKGIWLLPSDTDDSFTASEGQIANCYIRSNAAGIVFDTGAAPAVGVGSTDNKIFNNIFSRNTIDLLTADQGGGVYSIQFTNIFDNQFVDKNKATYIDFTTTNGGAAGDQSGSVNSNYFATDTMSNTKIKAVGTAFTFAGNIDTVGMFDGSGLD
jgi:hypothetical protein